MEQREFEGRKIMVLGASSGIGRACAIRLLSMYRPRRFRLRCHWLPNGFFHCARLLYRQLSGRFLRTRLPYR